MYLFLNRRYGVVEGRFCFEGGSHCGKGEGLHVLVTDQAEEITYTFDLAAQGKLSPRKRPLMLRKNSGKLLADCFYSNLIYTLVNIVVYFRYRESEISQSLSSRYTIVRTEYNR